MYYYFCLKYSKLEDNVILSKEKLSFSEIMLNERKTNHVKCIINFNIKNNKEEIFSPKKVFGLVSDQYKEELKLGYKNSTSFIFSQININVFELCIKNKNRLYVDIINAMKYFSANLLVIKDNNLANVDLNNICWLNKKELYQEKNEFDLFAINKIDIDIYPLLKDIIQKMNIVIGSIFEGLHLEIKSVQEDNKCVVELISVRDKLKLKLKDESSGVKKIVSMLYTLILIHNYEEICVVIDDFDSNLYEYFLGELLTTLKEKGRGQLIFTFNNLRVLEVLNKNDIIFTTNNPNNRYIRLNKVKKTANLRNVYLKMLFLDDDIMCKKVKAYSLSRAFRNSKI